MLGYLLVSQKRIKTNQRSPIMDDRWGKNYPRSFIQLIFFTILLKLNYNEFDNNNNYYYAPELNVYFY